MKRLVSLLISLIILGLIYWKIDFSKIVPVFGNASLPWLAASLGMVLPLTLFTAWRLCQLMPRGMPLGFWESNRLILLASVLNMVLPSKMGDVAKAGFMAERGHLKGSLAVALVVFEKACDMASLLAWCVFGLVLYPQKDLLFWTMTACVGLGFLFLAVLVGSQTFARLFFRGVRQFAPKKIGKKFAILEESWMEMHGYFWGDLPKLWSVVGTSLGIWFLHLLQIWMFTLAINTSVPFLSNMALAPLAILAGLLPLTFAGIGTRDAALIYFYSPYMAAADGAALGVLCTMRYFLPALAGLPFLGPALASVAGKMKVKK
jgi:uncharacterized protein (TIRG00374 family)